MKTNQSDLKRVESSFRDPSGYVYKHGERIYRTIRSRAEKDYQLLRDAGIYEQLIKSGKLIFSKEISPNGFQFLDPDVKYIVEHQKLPIITYPYEWPFNALKAAALFHLELQLQLLNLNVVLSDASAYNVQFVGARPIFIDFLSFRAYQDGEYWLGHRQFCEHFLFPLILRSLRGISHNTWLRGSPEGLSLENVMELIPFRSKLSLRVMMHLLLPHWLKKRAMKQTKTKLPTAVTHHRLPKNTYASILKQLHKWIVSLHTPKSQRSTWGDYTLLSSYSINEADEKIAFVKRFTQAIQPEILLDLGCNNGEYSELALANGAKSVVGIDSDPQACDFAFTRASLKGLPLNVLQLDMTNPSPPQGWRGEEFQSLNSRLCADGLLALAVLHHFVLGKNIPLASVVDYLIKLSPQGIIEFVDKFDEQVQKMLKFREDIFSDYTKENFLATVRASAEIVEMKEVKKSNRLLVWYKRHQN